MAPEAVSSHARFPKPRCCGCHPRSTSPGRVSAWRQEHCPQPLRTAACFSERFWILFWRLRRHLASKRAQARVAKPGFEARTLLHRRAVLRARHAGNRQENQRRFRLALRACRRPTFVNATKVGKSALKGAGDRSGLQQPMPAGFSATPPGLVPAAVYRGCEETSAKPGPRRTAVNQSNALCLRAGLRHRQRAQARVAKPE